MANPNTLEAPIGTPFSLRCIGCDAGDGLDSEAEAAAAGWVEIQYDDGLSWNFLGYCLDCQPYYLGEPCQTRTL